MDLASIDRALAKRVDKLRFGDPVAYVYNPLLYAQAPHEEYLRLYGRAPKELVLLGMNPGPFGMAQTGVPFGEVAAVRDWLGINGLVHKPAEEHPKRPVQGFACTRSEVSGARLWGWARDRFKTPRRFFERFFVVNYCPLAFMEASGRNVTPDKLPTQAREPLFAACDEALRRTVELLGARHVIGIGAFAEKRARLALVDTGTRVGTILHPSPASPKANRDWAGTVNRQLADMGISVR